MSESDIDMDRAMQGIDDADSHVPEITWTNCADEMPPDEDDKILIHMVETSFYSICTRAQLIRAKDKSNWNWTPFTPEKWKELNK